jgi:transcriptional regulator with XRE-family HTH domain
MNATDKEYLNARIAETIQVARQRTMDPESGKAYTQRTFANAIGLSRTTVSNVENRRQQVSLDYLYRAALVLKLRLDQLLPDPAEVAPSIGLGLIPHQKKQDDSALESLLAQRIKPVRID